MRKAKNSGRKVNKEELAAIMGVSPTTIATWLSRGCPYVEKGERGKSYIFDTEAVRVWRENSVVKRAVGSDGGETASLDMRLKIAVVEREELSLAKEKGLVAPIEEFERANIEAFAKIRARLRMTAPKLALLLVGQTDETTIRNLIANEIDDALRMLGSEPLLDEAQTFMELGK